MNENLCVLKGILIGESLLLRMSLVYSSSKLFAVTLWPGRGGNRQSVRAVSELAISNQQSVVSNQQSVLSSQQAVITFSQQSLALVARDVNRSGKARQYC